MPFGTGTCLIPKTAVDRGAIAILPFGTGTYLILKTAVARAWHGRLARDSWARCPCHTSPIPNVGLSCRREKKLVVPELHKLQACVYAASTRASYLTGGGTGYSCVGRLVVPFCASFRRQAGRVRSPARRLPILSSADSCPTPSRYYPRPRNQSGTQT